ncbi:MAG: MATE family efflux transporter [Lachnospiraceae bacterium]|nr:MATE family efflux transporter [Lachnospiraceae bacterium]
MSQKIVNEQNKMGSQPVGRLLFAMALPMTISMLFQALYNVVDSYFVSKLSQDSNALNAVSLAFPMQSLLIAFSVGTGVGTGALVARSLGEKREDRAREVAGTGMFLALMMAALFSLAGLLFARTYFSLQTRNETIIRYGGDYLTIIMGGCFFLFSQVNLERLLQATGRTDKSMIVQITGAVINMILDPLFIFGYAGFPRLEVKGAAIATLIGQSIATVVGILLNLKYNTELRAAFKMIRFRRSIAANIYRIGLPSILMQSIGSVVNFCMNQILIGFTEAATAVYGAYFKLQSFVFMPIFGLNNAMVPIISYNYGARNYERVRQTYRLSIAAAVSIMCLGALLFLTIPHLLLGIFSPTEEMLQIGVKALRIICLHFLLAGFCIISGSVCQAIGNPLHSLLISVCRQVIVLLPAAYLLSLGGVLDRVWLAFPLAEIVSFALSFYFLRKTVRKMQQVSETYSK